MCCISEYLKARRRKNVIHKHLSDLCLLQNENLKPSKKRSAVFESLVCLKNDKIIF